MIWVRSHPTSCHGVFPDLRSFKPDKKVDQDGEVVDVFLKTQHDTGQRVLTKSLLNFVLKVRHIPGKARHGTEKVEYETEVVVQTDELKRIGQGWI